MCARRGFTLIELLVVIAIIAVLIGLLVPAVQKVRESANRTECSNNLKQFALAAHNHHGEHNSFPGGMYLFPVPGGKPPSQGYTWFVPLLPYLEQQNIYASWNFVTPITNGQVTAAVPVPPASRVWSLLLCPSDLIPANPYPPRKHPPGNFLWGITSYGGNGGSQSYPIATSDGMFFPIGPATAIDQKEGVRIAQVLDGLSNTLFFGERSHRDPNFDAAVAANPGLSIDLMGGYGWWGSPSPEAPADVTESAFAPLNYLVPENGGNQATINMRICAWGSLHSGGANFALADGSVRFITNTIQQSVLLMLSTRAGGEVIPNYD